jgi:ABC-type nickel/cobalt efflux system permease component RcnA
MRMNAADISLIERVVESSPVIVIILLLACGLLWRTLREEMREWRAIAKAHGEAMTALTAAVDKLRERIEGSR